jgi:NHL repeat
MINPKQLFVLLTLLQATVLARGQANSAYVWRNFVGEPGGPGNTDGTNSAARFNSQRGVAVDSAGNVYVADALNQTIRKITSAGVVTTLAGVAGQSGSADGTNSAARFYYPGGVAADNAGNLYVVDELNQTIRKVTLVGTNWVVTTLAGFAGQSGTTDGTNSAARFYGPFGMAVDNAGNLYVSDTLNHTIRKVTPVGTNWVVTTLAGLAGQAGSVDGTNSAALFSSPWGIAVDSAGNVYVADTDNNTIRKVTSDGVVTTLAGLATNSGSVDGTNSAARFDYPYSVAVDSAGNLYVADFWNHTIRKVTPVGTNWVVTTLAGLAGQSGNTDGTSSAARFRHPEGVAVDSAGNLYVADTGNQTIRKVTPVGTNWVVTTIGGTAGVASSVDGVGSAALFSDPWGIAVDSAGNVYVADSLNNRISKGTPVPTLTSVQEVERLIAEVESSWPRSQPLVASLYAALHSIQRGNMVPAVNQLARI